MKIIFPGTGSGVTSLTHNHSSLLIQDDENILIDTGDGISKALLSLGVYAEEIDKIIISHLHADHFAGLASLITQMKLQNKTTPLEIFIHPGHIKNAKHFLNMSNLFDELFDFEVTWTGINFGLEYKISKKLNLLPIKNDHIGNKPNLTGYSNIPFVSSSFKLKTNSSNIFYTADLFSISDFDKFDLSDVDILITEITHLKFDDLINALQTFTLKKLYLTHIPDELREHLPALVENIQDSVNYEIIIADDGMEFEL